MKKKLTILFLMIGLFIPNTCFAYENNKVFELSQMETYRLGYAEGLAGKEFSPLGKRVKVIYKAYMDKVLDIKTNEDFNKLVKDFQPSNPNNSKETMRDIALYIRKLGLVYDYRNIEDANKNQVDNLPKGYTRCYGITAFTTRLLDKTNIKYRVIRYAYIMSDTGKFSKIDGGHMYLQVLTDDSKWATIDLTTILNLKVNPNKFVDKSFEVLEDSSISVGKKIGNPITENYDKPYIQEFYIFPERLAGKDVFDSNFYVTQVEINNNK